MWGKIMIPMYRLWLPGLHGLYEPRYLLSPQKAVKLNHSLTLALSTILKHLYWFYKPKQTISNSFVGLCIMTINYVNNEMLLLQCPSRTIVTMMTVEDGVKSQITISTDHCFRLWLVACLAPSHYLNWCWMIVKIDHCKISVIPEMNKMHLNMSSAKWRPSYRASMFQNAPIYFNIHDINITCT